MAKPPELSDTLPAPAASAERTPIEPTLAVAVSAAMSGEQLPYQAWERYQIVAFLGAGGMGAVYKARDPRLHRSVAIKFLRGSQAEAFDTRQRRHFEREARAQARIEHPHICKIYEVGEVEGQPYIAMQFIHGSSLAGLQQVMTREDKVRAIQKVAESLHAAHTQNLVHRDIKPGNIMVERRPDGAWWPYLMDFGLAREVDSNSQTSTGGVEGTPAYMAPEQARGEVRSLDARSDVYGLGATLYSALAGRPPFVGNSIDVLVSVLLSDPPRLRTLDPGISLLLEIIVEKCLEKEPARRYPSVQALADDLGRYLRGDPIAARPPGPLRRAARFIERHRLLVASAAAALVASLVLGGVALRIRWQAAAEARLAQRLGQEVTQLEWLLRSARQLPLHDLAREKVIIRERMAALQSELRGDGAWSRGLAHYALGRGHMALHEYPQALVQLEEASRLGVKSAELHYALGVVLGKHFEQAMYEARLAGGGEWAKKQLKQIEPRYLTPALAALTKSRAAKLDAPQYLEGLIAYYQRDYDAALKQAEAAQRAAPWLYEASKLAGDVHLDQALQARDSGRNEEADRHFAGALKSYQAAAAVGQSDAEVYIGLAETWVRQIEMMTNRGQSAETVYAAAVAASDKIEAAEPDSIEGPLKKAFAAMMTMSIMGSGQASAARARQCIAASAAVLQKQPGHPYASEAGACCHMLAAEAAKSQGRDPLPSLHEALRLLEPTIQKYPHFLWALTDFGTLNINLGTYLQKQGSPSAKATLQKALEYFAAAAALDPTSNNAAVAALFGWVPMIPEARDEDELSKMLAQADAWFAKCKAINSQYQQCFNNYFQVYARAANRSLLAGQDPQPRLKRALENLAETRRLGGQMLDEAQHAALAHLVDAQDRQARGRDPTAALAELQIDVGRCFAIDAQDAMCRTLDARGEWVRADWLAAQKQPSLPALQSALKKAQLATTSAEPHPDAWQTLAETELRLARVAPPAARPPHLDAGLAATARVFSINAQHAAGLATQGALQLARAEAARDETARRALAAEAAQSLAKALKSDPFLARSQTALLNAAQEMNRALAIR